MLGISCGDNDEKPSSPTPSGAYYKSMNNGDEGIFIFNNGRLLAISYVNGTYEGITSSYSLKDNFINQSEAQIIDENCNVTKGLATNRLAYQFHSDELYISAAGEMGGVH